MTLTEFLLARIAEDEVVARSKMVDPYDWASRDGVGLAGPVDGPSGYEALIIDPARVLAECAAKRLVLTMHEDHMSQVRAYRSPRWQEVEDNDNRCDRLKAEARGRVSSDMVQALAQPYADHPDFLDEWRWENR